MGFPKLKHPIFCRILSYVVVIGLGLLPIFVVYALPVHGLIKGLVLIGSLLGLLAYLVNNFMILMTMDMSLALLSCLKTARKQYTISPHRTPEIIRRSILRYGIACDHGPCEPYPSALRYKFSSPMTIYSCGIERVVAAYELDFLDKDTYYSILRSAKTNSKALIGKRKARFLDKEQKKSALHRVTVVLILAHKIDPQLIPGLYDLVCRQCGDEDENCIIPCVVDLAQHTCVFNCVRVPYIGYNYAVKNRGIRIIKHRVLGGRLNLRGNTAYLPSISDLNPNDSLWDYWKELRHEFIGAEKETRRIFKSLSEKEIRLKKDELYLKWDQRGVCQTVKLDTEHKIVQVEEVTDWFYPKIQPIGKRIKQQITQHIASYYEKSGYSVKFVSIDELL